MTVAGTLLRTTVKIKKYNADSGYVEETGETMETGTLARSLTLDNFVELFDDFLNIGGKQLQEGIEVGRQLRQTHRTLQRLAVCFALGVVVGLADQQYTDPRNEHAIETAKKIDEMIATGELNLGAFI